MALTRSPDVKYGTAQIAAARLEAVPNPKTERDYLIALNCPEFTCLCPRSGFPDFAEIRIRYVPDHSVVELKSLKLYLNQYRDRGIFHEAAVNEILDDLVKTVAPRWMQVIGDFNVRGNIKTVVTAVHRQPSYDGPAPELLRTPAEDSG